MDAKHPAVVARKACKRCSNQKKKCDKALPECGLCARLGQICKYENWTPPVQTPSSSASLDSSLNLGAFTCSQIKAAVIQKLGSLEPENAIIRWSEASLEISLLCLSIFLLTTTPASSLEDDGNLSELKGLYLCIKCWISMIEGLGGNSIELLQTRILVTLFEVSHGFYPAAHISMGSVVRAADALVAHPAAGNLPSDYPSDEARQEERILTWCGITTLDRYIALESVSYAPITRSYLHPTYTPLWPHLCPTNAAGQDRAAPLGRFSRLFEASSLLDKFQTALNDPTAEQSFNIEEVLLIIKTVDSLKAILLGEIHDGKEMYSIALGLCDIGLLLAFDNGTKVDSYDAGLSRCQALGIRSLNLLLSNLITKVESFTLSTQPVEFDLLPPSTMFLVYKAASFVTERLRIDGELSEGVRRLRILRGFLKTVGRRWLCCRRYLQLLDEDTTPRILRAVEQE